MLINDLNNNQASRDRDKEKDKEGQIFIDFNDFLDIMTTKMSERNSETELKRAFDLFCQQRGHIELQDLTRIARELGENMSEDELKEMMNEANHRNDGEGVVTYQEFLGILSNQTDSTA